MMTQHLSPEQTARAEALRTAAYILARPKALGSFSTTPPNVVEPVDVHSLAEYILNGGDPWVPTNASGPVPSMTYFGHPLYTLAEVDNAVRAALDSVKREFIAKHCGGAVTSMCARNLTRILDEVRP